MSLLFVVSLGAAAQDTYPWEEYLREVMTAEDAESSAWEEVYDQLCELSLHPFDINTATRSQLEDLPFLSAQQIEEIVEYLYRYGPMKSKGELLMIRSLDEPSRQLLSSVCYVGEPARPAFPSVKEIARYGHHELMATARVPFEEKNEDYLGSSLRHWMRYQFNYGSYVKLGLLGANDAGEPFFANRNRWGYDYYAFYLQLKGLGRLESLCLGHYRVTMGMGLVMNSHPRPPSGLTPLVLITTCKVLLPPFASQTISRSQVSSPIALRMPRSIATAQLPPSSVLLIIAPKARWIRSITWRH